MIHNPSLLPKIKEKKKEPGKMQNNSFFKKSKKTASYPAKLF
jgi:hypothetical protein